MKTDTIFYNLFQESPSIFFELIGHPETDADAYQFTSVELKQTSFRIDGLLRPTVETSPIYFVEVQFQKDSTFYSRLFAEIFLYLHQYPSNQDWRAVVIYPRRSREPTEVTPYRTLLESEQVQRVYLDELSDFTSIGLGLVQLIVEKKSRIPNRVSRLLQQVRQDITESTTQEKLIQLIETILIYKFSTLSREEVQAMFGLDEFKQSRLYQEIKQEGKEEGRLEGKEEGKAEGKAEGRLEGKEEGKAEGKAEGRLEGKLESVPQLLAIGLTVEQVATALGLTVEQVQSVRRE